MFMGFSLIVFLSAAEQAATRQPSASVYPRILMDIRIRKDASSPSPALRAPSPVRRERDEASAALGVMAVPDRGDLNLAGAFIFSFYAPAAKPEPQLIHR